MCQVTRGAECFGSCQFIWVQLGRFRVRYEFILGSIWVHFGSMSFKEGSTRVFGFIWVHFDSFYFIMIDFASSTPIPLVSRVGSTPFQ
jgi:hypothetical protein